MARSRNKLLSSAVKKGGAIYALPTPAKHPDIIRHYRGLGMRIANGQRGFLDENMRFLNRTQAYRVAKAADQIKRDTEGRKQLHSEDVWGAKEQRSSSGSLGTSRRRGRRP